jgi:exodeoxyribonuclease-5
MSKAISILDYLHFDNPTAMQKSALLAMVDFVKEDNKDDFFILCGAAGTGKTSVTSALIGYLNNGGIHYKIAAPTGRAARILGRKTNTQNSTIHSMIYNADANPETGVVKFTLKDAEDEDYCVFIVDEASMINAMTNTREDSLFVAADSLLNDLVKYVKSGNGRNKLLLLGDRNQLPPVHEKDSYALMPDFLNQKYGWQGSFHLLTEVKRQEDGSYILKNATNICRAIENGSKNCNIEAPFFAFQFAVNKYVEDYRNMSSDSCISIGCTHNSNQYFNDMVRKRLYGDKAPIIVAGDLMLVTQKWSRNGQALYNGDHVTVEEILLDQLDVVAGLSFVPVKIKSKDLAGKEHTIEDYLLLDSIFSPSGSLPSDRERAIRHERYSKNKVYRESGKPEDDKYIGAIRLAYGHSITCNKAQGGEWEKVYMNCYTIPSLKYSYTAVTRAKTTLIKY